MLYEPTNIVPSTLTNTGTVAADDDAQIEWQVNGNSKLYQLQIDIYKNDYSSTLVYSTGMWSGVNESSTQLPFYGKDRYGNNVKFVYNLEKTWGDLGLEDGESYKYKITQGYYPANKSVIYKTMSVTPTANQTYYFTGTIDGTTYYFYFTVTDVSLIPSGSYIYYNLTDEAGYISKTNEYGTNKRYFFYTVGKTTTKPSGTSLGSGTTGTTNIGLVEHNSFSVINLRSTPTLTVNSFTTPVESASLACEATYNQSQYDSIKWVRWQLANADSDGNVDEDELLDDTGVVYTPVLEYEYVGLLSGNYYAVKCIVETENGIQVETEWTVFETSYESGSYTGEFTVECNKNEDCNLLTWENDDGSLDIGGFIVKRIENGDEATAKTIAQVDSTVTQIKDFGIKSCAYYMYRLYVFDSAGAFIGIVETSSVSRQLQRFTLLATEYSEDDNAYHVAKEYQFSANLSSTTLSNNDSSSFVENFTRYPTELKGSANYASGTLSGLIGYIDYTYSGGYTGDTSALQKELLELPISGYEFFLKDFKGNLWQVAIGNAIQISYNHKTKQQESTISLPWREIADAELASIVCLPTDSGWYNDSDVLGVEFTVDLESGGLGVTYPDGYSLQGTTFSIENVEESTDKSDEELIATTPDGTTAADFENSDGEVFAAVKDE